MRYANYVKKISDTLAKYKTDVDTLEGLYRADKQKVQAKADEMKGKWTDEYINQYLSEHSPDKNYKARLQGARAAVEPTVLHYLEMLEKSLDRYFNAPIKPDFANKIMAIKLSGLQLTDLEFKILQDSATSYMECRLLNQLAESRTKTEKKTVLNKQSGEPEYQTVQTADPYIRMELPDIDSIYKAYESYRTAARGLLYSYAGHNAELSDMLENNIPNYVAINMDSYFRNGHEQEFAKVMDKANSILPESKIKRELTENDRKFIDTLIDSKYPSLARDRVKALAEADTDIESLLLLDERYNKYLEE